VLPEVYQLPPKARLPRPRVWIEKKAVQTADVVKLFKYLLY
jgi:hypothetical protein